MRDTTYPSTAIPPAHPARLAAFAMLHGLSAGFSERFSYLELGCGDATNLLALGAQFPEASFVGVDVDAAAIARGEELRRAAAIENVTLHAMDLRAFTPNDDARFDYAVAHGVISWAPPDVERRIFELCARHLAPEGVAYLSYNTLPGWGIRGVVRDMMRMSARRAESDAAKLRAGKSVVARLARHGLGEAHPYGVLLAAELDLVHGKHDGYLLGEYLADHNAPSYFTDFAERAAAHGLAYLAEALPATPDGAIEATVLGDLLAAGLGRIEAEQHLDVVCYRQFRGTLLCHAGASIWDRPDYGALVDRGFFAGRLQPTTPEPLLGPGHSLVFRTATRATIEVDRPLLKAALLALSQAFPEGLRAPEVASAAISALRERALLEACAIDHGEIERVVRDLVILCQRRQIELLPWTPRPARTPGDRPFATRLRRIDAARGRAVTTPRHEPTELDAPTRVVLELADGTRDPREMAREIGAFIDGGDLSLTPEERAALARPEARRALVDLALSRLTSMGLFDRPPDPRALPALGQAR